MPASYCIVPSLRLKYVHIAGRTQLSELLGIANRYFDDPQFSIENRYLIDLTDLTGAKAKFVDVFALKSFYQANFSNLKNPIDVAIVTNSKFGYGISRMFSTLMGNKKIMNVCIFTNFETAGKCLQIDCSELKKLQKKFA